MKFDNISVREKDDPFNCGPDPLIIFDSFLTSDAHIRSATCDDDAEINRLLSIYFLDRDEVSITDFTVIEIKGRVIGAAAFVQRLCPEVHTVVVHPNYRGKGYGRMLVSYLLCTCSRDIKNIYVRTTSPAFFEKLGFRPLPEGMAPQLWEDCRDCLEKDNCRQHLMFKENGGI